MIWPIAMGINLELELTGKDLHMHTKYARLQTLSTHTPIQTLSHTPHYFYLHVLRSRASGGRVALPHPPGPTVLPMYPTFTHIYAMQCTHAPCGTWPPRQSHRRPRSDWRALEAAAAHHLVPSFHHRLRVRVRARRAWLGAAQPVKRSHSLPRPRSR